MEPRCSVFWAPFRKCGLSRRSVGSRLIHQDQSVRLPRAADRPVPPDSARLFGAAIRAGRALGGACRSRAAASERPATLVVDLTLVDASAPPHRVSAAAVRVLQPVDSAAGGQRGVEKEPWADQRAAGVCQGAFLPREGLRIARAGDLEAQTHR
jgi:hypothetical protein